MESSMPAKGSPHNGESAAPSTAAGSIIGCKSRNWIICIERRVLRRSGRHWHIVRWLPGRGGDCLRERISHCNPAYSVEMTRPIGRVHMVNANEASRRGGVYKAMMANINAHMRVGMSIGVKKNQIPGGHLVRRDAFALRAHFSCGARQIEMRGALNHITHLSAAVKTALRRIAAPAVRHIDQTHGEQRNLFVTSAVIGPCRTRCGWRCSWRCARSVRAARRAGASGKQERNQYNPGSAAHWIRVCSEAADGGSGA